MSKDCNYLRRITAIHDDTMRRLVNCESMDPLELAAFLEDVGNKYLNIADQIASANPIRTARAAKSDHILQ